MNKYIIYKGANQGTVVGAYWRANKTSILTSESAWVMGDVPTNCHILRQIVSSARREAKWTTLRNEQIPAVA